MKQSHSQIVKILTADVAITHTTTYASEIASATTHSTNAQIGSSVKVEEGVYFIRGQFVRCTEQTLLLNASSTQKVQELVSQSKKNF